MMKKTFLCMVLCALACTHALAQDLQTEGLDSAYVQTIVARSEKIANECGATEEERLLAVRNIVANRYFLLNRIHEAYKSDVEAAKQLEGEARKEALSHATERRDAELYKHHFELEAALSLHLDAAQIERVKDGMTYGVVPKTYQAHLEMIPTLSDEEKAQILSWLKEAREFAIDADTSKEKHGWFGKYKGRINNWLAGRGYDLQKEREGWKRRIEEKKQP